MVRSKSDFFVDMECKFWIDEEIMDIREAFGYNLTPKARKEVRKIIFQYFDLIVQSLKECFKS